MNFIDVIRWILAIPLLLISAFFIFTNFRILFENFHIGLNAGRAPVTIIGGLTGSLGLLIMPAMTFGDRMALLWVPLFVDMGSAPFYLVMLVLALWQHLNSRLWHRHPDYIEENTE